MRFGRLVLILLSSTLFFAGVARAEAPGGPRLATIAFPPYPDPGSELRSIAPDGSDAFRIIGGPGATGPTSVASTRLSWSADGSRIAFIGARGDAPEAIFTVAADGSDPQVVPLSRKLLIEGDPVLAPDGRSVAVTRIDVISGHFQRRLLRGRATTSEYGVRVRTAIWSLGVGSTEMHPLTLWSRQAFLEPSSFSADGSHLAATEWSGRPVPRAVSVDLSTRRTKALAANATEPVYAADGSITMVRNRFSASRGRSEEHKLRSSTLLVAGPGSEQPRPIARVRGGLRWPSWDPSAQRIAFTRLKRLVLGKLGIPVPSSIAAVNADGSCLTAVAIPTGGSYAGSAWQPGPGREAGRIAC